MIMEQRGMDQLGVYSVLARKLLIASMGNGLIVPEFTGSHAIFGDGTAGFIEIYSSGTLTFSKKTIVDVYVMGSGLKGANGSGTTSGTTSYEYGGAGGKGAKGASYTGIEAMGDYDITVAATCSSTSTANASSAFGNSVRTTGASGGAGANGANGKNGSSGVSIPFGDSNNFHLNYGGGGGGGGGREFNRSLGVISQYMPGSGGSVGGGRGAHAGDAGAGEANTGGGGGGGSGSYGTMKNGANGGSGLVIVKWGF